MRFPRNNEWLLICLLVPISVLAVDDQFVRYQSQPIAITGVKLIDGRGSSAQDAMTVLLRDGRIERLGKSASMTVPEGYTVIGGEGKTLLPGFVMMHEHMFYPTGDGNYTEMLHSFPKLYLGGGATTVRTAGTMAPYADLNLRELINQNKAVGPDMDVTAPFLNGPGLPILKIKSLTGAANAARMMDYWASEGVTSYKVYMHIRSDELRTVISMAHQHDQKVTAHLCSITYREAAEMGIDNLEHGFFTATDFVQDKQKDVCPSADAVQRSLVDLDLGDRAVADLIQLLLQRGIAITSTLTVFETFTPGRPKAPQAALDVLLPQMKQQYENAWQEVAANTDDNDDAITRFQKAMALEKMFVEAGGTVLVGTDPTVEAMYQTVGLH